MFHIDRVYAASVSKSETLKPTFLKVSGETGWNSLGMKPGDFVCVYTASGSYCTCGELLSVRS